MPAHWERLERAAEDAASVVSAWKRRAVEAEAEVSRLRDSLEDLAASENELDTHEEIRRLRAENAAVTSRMVEARKRLGALARRLAALGVEP
jgi:predicted RNase H-like nuclease (RuvC/YqgF family)